MPLNPQRPLLYLITSGATTSQTTSSTKEFVQILKLTEAAVAARIDLLQIREKELNTRTLFDLATQAAAITRESSTQLLINGRADVASGAGADGVHLTSESVPVEAVRTAFGRDFVIGASTHSADEAEAARTSGADFVVFGPVFKTLSKPIYGDPLGTRALSQVVSTLAGFPVLALGGVEVDNVAACAQAGAAGVAAITMFGDAARLDAIANEVRSNFRQ